MAGRLVYTYYDHNASILRGQPSAPGRYFVYHAGLVLEISVRGNSIQVIQVGGCVRD